MTDIGWFCLSVVVVIVIFNVLVAIYMAIRLIKDIIKLRRDK